LKEYIEENSEFIDYKPVNIQPHPSHMKITGNFRIFKLIILGKGKYYNYKDFMEDYFEHRELLAMQPLERIRRIKKSREFYKPKRFQL